MTARWLAPGGRAVEHTQHALVGAASVERVGSAQEREAVVVVGAGAAAQPPLRLEQRHLYPGARCGRRRGEPRKPAAHHHHVVVHAP